MPTFDTPDPISVTVSANIAGVRLRAGDRPDTVVEVVPRDPDDDEDVRSAERSRVDFTAGALSVVAPKPWSRFSPRRTGGAIDVTIDLPAGSELRASAGILELHGRGRFGACSIRCSVGSVSLEECGTLDISSTGRVDVGAALGAVDVSGMDTIHFGRIDGAATVKNVNGDTRIDAVTGAARVRSANGPITVGVAGSDLDATTANGSVHVDEIVRGTVSLETANGSLRIGIRPGTAAKLDVRSSFGRVVNEIEHADGPEEADEIVTVRARTAYGDVVVGRPHENRENR